MVTILLPVGSSWKMLKCFCFIAYENYAMDVIEARGRKILYVKSNYWTPSSISSVLVNGMIYKDTSIRYRAHTSFDDLLIPWRHSNKIPLECGTRGFI
jgi:hypothetical protein